MSYAIKLKDPRWQKKRLQVFQRDNFTCQLCDDTKTELHAHHIAYSSHNPWESNIEDLQTLCRVCHTIVELDKGEYPIQKIIKHKLSDKILIVCAVKRNYNLHDFYYYDPIKDIATWQILLDIITLQDIFPKLLSLKNSQHG